MTQPTDMPHLGGAVKLWITLVETNYRLIGQKMEHRRSQTTIRFMQAIKCETLARNRDLVYHSPDDDLSVSPKPNAMVLFNPVVDFVNLDMASRFGLDPELAAQISPFQQVTKDLPLTLILIGSKDQFLDQSREFMSNAKELGVRVEIDVAIGQPHAYFNRSPWMEKTVSSADSFLVSLGYLTEEPPVDLPSSKEPR